MWSQAQNIDSTGELFLAGPFPLDFHRYYNSVDNLKQKCFLGGGIGTVLSSNWFFNLDGIEYQLADGGTIQFPMMEIEGSAVAGGFSIARVSEKEYEVVGPECSMQFRAVAENLALLFKIGFDADFVELEYDKLRRIETVIDSAGRKLAFSYDSRSLLKSVVWIAGRGDSNWTLLEYEYDLAGNLAKAIDAYGNEFSFEFDTANRMTRKTDRRGYSFHYQYDRSGRCILSEGSDGLHHVKLNYQPDIRCTEVVRGDKGKWLYFFSEDGDITRIIAPDGGATIYTHDEQGNVQQEMDPGGTAWTWVYDSTGQPLYKKNDLGDIRGIGEEDKDEVDPLETELPTNAAQREFGRIANVPSRGNKLDHDDFILGRRPPRLDRSTKVTHENGFLKTEDNRTYDHFGNFG